MGHGLQVIWRTLYICALGLPAAWVVLIELRHLTTASWPESGRPRFNDQSPKKATPSIVY